MNEKAPDRRRLDHYLGRYDASKNNRPHKGIQCLDALEQLAARWVKKRSDETTGPALRAVGGGDL